ncbi:hypothetical protein ACWKWC_17210 [Geodermatophilus nigrescens]|uniref:hypothetical protein n=1 Tax=Geodermatophilus sp. FMUSA9-8 TaxID=3120155 RepID=UPI0030095614
MPTFFLPRATDDDQAERLYEALAEFAGVEPAPPGERVRSVTWTHEGARWVAEVGAELRGERTTSFLRRGELVEHTETLTDPARVLAVYPGTPHTVVTDAQPITGTASQWPNPIPVRPDAVVPFDPR